MSATLPTLKAVGRLVVAFPSQRHWTEDTIGAYADHLDGVEVELLNLAVDLLIRSHQENTAPRVAHVLAAAAEVQRQARHQTGYVPSRERAWRTCNCDHGWVWVGDAITPCPRCASEAHTRWERGEFEPSRRQPSDREAVPMPPEVKTLAAALRTLPRKART